MNTSDHSLSQRLSELPPLEPPPALWRSIEGELDRQQAGRRLRRWAGVSTAMAAALVLAVVIGILHQSDLTPPSGLETDPALAQARQISALLEAQLRQQHFGAVSTVAVESLVWLESELGWLDSRLASDPNNLALWQRRTELLSEMNQLYGQSNWQAEMRLTSL